MQTIIECTIVKHDFVCLVSNFNGISFFKGDMPFLYSAFILFVRDNVSRIVEKQSLFYFLDGSFSEK